MVKQVNHEVPTPCCKCGMKDSKWYMYPTTDGWVCEKCTKPNIKG